MDEFPWALETMRLINELTPNIQGKAFDPDWFLLRNRLEEFERASVAALAAAREDERERCAKVVEAVFRGQNMVGGAIRSLTFAEIAEAIRRSAGEGGTNGTNRDS